MSNATETNDYRIIIDPNGIEGSTEYFIGIKLANGQWDVPFDVYFSPETMKKELTEMLLAFKKPSLKLNDDDTYTELSTAS